jgi:fatty-acyl-CoA synthase
VRRRDVTYAGAPLFHIGALNSFALRALVRGGVVVVVRSFDPARFLADLAAYGVNSAFMVPARLAAVARVPQAFAADFSSLGSVVVAGAPVPPALIETYAAHGVLLQQAWGLTETAPFATHLPAEQTLDKIGSAGIPMPYTEVRVVDVESGADAGPGVPGEVIVRGPDVSPGYWNYPRATAAAFDAEGWFHSGDIGLLDDDGYLYIAGMPGVVDVAVVGAPDPDWGETVVAIMSVEDGAPVGVDEVREYAAAALARYKLPRMLQIVPSVPRNASGKLDKLQIRRKVSS